MRRGRFHRVYSAHHPFEAHFVRTVLESHGVWATVQNENLAPYGVGAEVWIESDQIEMARDVLEALEPDATGQLSLVPTDDARGALAPVETSPCPQCGEPRRDPSEPCAGCASDAES